MAPRGLPENSQFLRPITKGRIACSQGIVVRRKLRVIEVADQLLPLSQGERYRLADGRAGHHLILFLPQPGVHLVEHRLRLCAPLCQEVVRIRFPILG